MADIIEMMRGWAKGRPVPAHDEITAQHKALLMHRRAWGLGLADFDLRKTVSLFEARQEAISNFGFTIPSAELLAALKAREPIVEIGAGTGYLTSLMRGHGIDVVGTDAQVPQYTFRPGALDPDQLKIAGKTAVRRFPDRTVFCSWPSYNETWFRQALKAMRVGQRLVVVEESACAEDTAWAYRDACFEREERDIPIPAWPHMNDRASAWVKRRNRR